MADTSSIAIATNIFTAPSQAFVAIKERAPLLLPVLLLLIAYSSVNFLYLSRVDMGWFLDQQMQQQQQASGQQLPPEQRERALDAAAKVPKVVYGAIGAVSTSAVVFLVIFLGALYYKIVSFATRDGVSLKQWFALSCWCLLPSLLAILAQIANLLINDARFMPADSLNPLSFGNLLSIDRTGATVVQRILLGLDVFTLWGVVLSILGYQAFTKRSLPKAAAIALGPLVAIVLIATLIALLRS
jgi:hypothetical protein